MAAFTEKEMNEFKMANWYDLSGQVAIVTGGSTGLGLAVTRCLVSAGAGGRGAGGIWLSGSLLPV